MPAFVRLERLLDGARPELSDVQRQATPGLQLLGVALPVHLAVQARQLAQRDE